MEGHPPQRAPNGSHCLGIRKHPSFLSVLVNLAHNILSLGRDGKFVPTKCLSNSVDRHLLGLLSNLASACLFSLVRQYAKRGG